MANFDPDAYLASKLKPQGFDPDAYLASKKEIPEWKQTAQNWVNTLPTVGAIGGGIFGTAGTPGPGTIAGAGLGGMAGKYLQGIIETGLDLPNKPQTRAAAHLEPLKEGLLSATGEGIGLRVGQALKAAKPASKQEIEAVKAIAKNPEVVPEVISRKGPMELAEKMFENTPKANIEEIKAAAERLGVDITPAMGSSNKEVQVLERILADRPTLAGHSIRKAQEPIREALSSGAEKIAETSAMTPHESGAKAQSLLSAKIAERLQPLKMSYDEIGQSTRNAAVNPSNVTRATERLARSPLNEIPGSEGSSIINRYSDMMKSAKTANGLNTVISEAKAELRELRGPGREALKAVISSGERLQRRGIISAGVEAAGAEGAKTAKGLIGQIRQTNRGYAQLANELKGAIGNAKIRKGAGPGEVLDSLSKRDDVEKMAEQLFNTQNLESLNKLKSFEPEAFNVLRQNRLNKLVAASSTKGKVDPSRMIRNIRKFAPEVQAHLVGPENMTKLKDMEVIINSFPEIVNPSGTAKGIAWGNYVSPGHYIDELSDAIKLRMLRSGATPIPVKALKSARGLISSPGLPASIQTTRGLMKEDER